MLNFAFGFTLDSGKGNNALTLYAMSSEADLYFLSSDPLKPADLNQAEPVGYSPEELLERSHELLENALKFNDLRLLHLLWKNGIKGEHPYLSALYLDFENGYIPG